LTLSFVLLVGLLASATPQKKTTPKRRPPPATQSKTPFPSTAPATAPVRDAIAGAFVMVPAGSFLMGAPDHVPADDYFEYWAKQSRPQHRVTISRAFEMGKYEVTQAIWEKVMGSNPSWLKGADLPVTMVSWDDVQLFLREMNRGDPNYTNRLPTEAEWEYACRAGTTGDYAGDLDAMAWYAENSGDQRISVDDAFKNDPSRLPSLLAKNHCRVHPVGQKQPNDWGLYDMHGNVMEWCSDWHGYEYYAESPSADPPGPAEGKSRILRGGNLGDPTYFCASTMRRFDLSRQQRAYIGFRLVRTAR